MPVQLPELSRFQPTEPTSVGRVQTQVADTTAPERTIEKAVTGTADTAIKYFDEQDQAAATLQGTKAGLDFSARYKGALRDVKNLKGDPTEAYSKLDEDSKQWESDILSQYEGASQRTKAAVQDRLTKARWQLADDRQTSEALQRSQFDTQTTDASVAVKKDNALTAVGTLDAKDPDTFRHTLAPLQLQLDGITDDRIEKGFRDGLVKKDENGNITYVAPQIKEQLRKDTSDVVENSVKILNAVGKTAEAKALMEEYSDSLTAKARADLAKGTKDADIDNAAYLMANKYKGLDPAVAMQKIDALPAETADEIKTKEKAQGIIHTHSVRMDQAKTSQQKNNYENAANYVRSSNFATVEELNDDNVIKGLEARGGFSKSQKDALEKMVVAPKASDPGTKSSAYDKLFNGEFQGMSYADFAHATAGLEKKDKAFFEKQWTNANQTTDIESSKMVTYMGKQLQAQLNESGVIKHNQYGKYDDANLNKINKWNDEMMDTIKTFPPGTNVMQQNQYVRDFVAKKISGEAFTGVAGSQPQKFQSSPVKQKPVDTTVVVQDPIKAAATNGSYSDLTPDKKKYWVVEFSKANAGQPPKTPGELMTFIKSRGNK